MFFFINSIDLFFLITSILVGRIDFAELSGAADRLTDRSTANGKLSREKKSDANGTERRLLLSSTSTRNLLSTKLFLLLLVTCNLFWSFGTIHNKFVADTSVFRIKKQNKTNKSVSILVLFWKKIQ